MALRIHFTGEDLARVTLPCYTGATVGEAILSLQILRQTGQPLHFGPWRDRLRARLPSGLAPLLQLVPATGWIPDFLTPARLDCADEFEAMSSTPQRRIAEDLARVDSAHRLPSWTRSLADGSPEALEAVKDAIRAYQTAAIAPHAQQIEAMVDAERMRLVRIMADGGADALLAAVHPAIRWTSPVLHVPSDDDRDLYLEGRGLAVCPRYFCGPQPRALINDTDLPVVVYAVPFNPLHPNPLATPTTAPDSPSSLSTLLGRTRAAVLTAITDRPGFSTSQLAERVNISVASASEHASVLRDAGLIASQRIRQTVVHMPTALAAQLLDTAH
jgi:DNA-binding transcriptional ArsR family regulator